MPKKIWVPFLALGLLISISGCDLVRDRPVGLGYSAKYICSSVFNSGFDDAQVVDKFVAPTVKPLPLVWRMEIDHNKQEVRVWDLIFGKRLGATAFYTPGKGCTLLVDQTEADVESIPFKPMPPPKLNSAIPWPYGSGGKPARRIPGLDYKRINRAVKKAFEERFASPANTTSIVVAYDGKLVAEAYGNGATEETPLLGWSMTKTVTGMLAGILSDQGRLDLDAPAPIPQWQGTDKSAITTRNLLHMAGGLLVDENYSHYSDVTKMLYLESNQFDYALRQPKVYEPGTKFQYSTAEGNRLAAVVQETLGGTQQAMYDFYQSQLFHKVDISSAFIEFDAHGNMVGGAYGFMKARDWARLGELYLQQGEWNGTQVISRNFVDFATHSSPTAADYGAMIWLNTKGISWPSIPHDAYFFAGHEGQYVVIIPSKKLVVVRTGVTEDPKLAKKDIMTPLLEEIIASLPKKG